MSVTSKARKAKGGDSLQLVGKTPNKLSDLKQDQQTKLSDKSQPTAEQIRIAQIIDNKTEDPALKDKVIQVMDATQKTYDEAYTALHDCDNDANRAVNLLLEGVECQWSTSSKKKKNRSLSEKNVKDKEPQPEASPEEDNREPSVGSKTTQPRGRGRGGFRGGRGGGTTPITNNDSSERSKRGKVLNGPSRGRGNRGRIQTRGFGRARSTFRRPPIDTWDPQKPSTNQIHHDPNADDWDNEEYTGSLATSQIYTSSGSGSTPPVSNSNISNNTSQNDYDNLRLMQGDSSIKAIVNDGTIKHSEMSMPYKQFSPITTIPEPNEISLTSPLRVRSPTGAGGLIMMASRADRTLENQDMRMQRPSRPKLPPPSKSPIDLLPYLNALSFRLSYGIPASAVIMPPDSIETNIGLLDVQFGGMELNDNSTEVQLSPSPVRHSPSPSSSDKLLTHQTGNAADSMLLTESSFSPVRNSGSTSLSQMSDLTSKVSDVTSSLYQDSSFQNSPYVKAAQQSPSVYSSAYSTNQKTWLNISTGSEETSTDEAAREQEEWKLLSSAAPPISTPFSDFERGENDMPVRTVLSSGAQTITSDEQTEPEEQVEEVITPSSRKEVNSTNSIIYSTSANQNSYSSTGGVYGGLSSSYPQYQYSSYPSQQNQTSLPMLTNSSNSYQSALGSLQYGSNTQSVYGTSGLPTPSYSTPYQTFNSSVQLTHTKQTLMASSSNNKEFEATQPSVNLNSISHAGSINPTPTLLSAAQTTPTSKPTSLPNLNKNAVVTNMPPGVPPLVGTQYINVQGVPYFQQPMYYDELQLMQQQRLPPHISTGYYEMGYPTSTTREGVQYNLNDGRFARTDNTSPVQASSLSQQSGSQPHQQPMLNPSIPQAYAYFYGSSMIPGNFQYGAPATLYPMATGGTTSGHGNTTSGVYGKAPNNFSGNYSGNYETSQSTNSGSATDFKSTSSGVSKVQPTQSGNLSSNSDIVNIYSKPLSKSYEKQGFHCATPPPFNLGSQSSGMGPGGGYAQHLFIPAMTPHHNTTTLLHQPIHQDGANTMSARSQGGNQPAKVVMTKPNYSSSTYWTQN